MRQERVTPIYRKLQQQICAELEKADGKAVFQPDDWEKKIGFGHTMVLTDGDAIEKAAVNFSSVGGPVTLSMREALRIGDGQEEYFACGISSIIHPQNPNVPIIHMNVRYFELSSGKSWFGGGIDLTPHYIDIQEAAWFHGELKTICEQYDPECYSEFKNWADDYFYLPHRDETRGVGGIFFDHRDSGDDNNFERILAFTEELAQAYPRIYSGLIAKNRSKPFTEKEKQWQYLRRGRYVEFNLLYDRGTKFGLESDGRVESIFLSMPPFASWAYNFEPEKGSREAETLSLLKKGTDWSAIQTRFRPSVNYHLTT